MQDIFSGNLNEEQLQALKITNRPVLILAGAGSGKTRVITYKIAYLIEEKKNLPHNIFAVTFTNKAAEEMKQRVSTILKNSTVSTDRMWVSTFHSACARILRNEAHKIGFDNNFTIYDTDDSVKLLKDILISQGFSKKDSANVVKKAYKKISFAKNKFNPQDNDFIVNIRGEDRNFFDEYLEYEKRLKKCNAFDFDNLILKVIELFKTNTQTLNYYREKFKYVLVDEFQDTNKAQYELIKLLCHGKNNVSVVGDDDQSIYSFRGAVIRNIFDFTEDFENCEVIRLEQNYRSTQNILDTSNKVISFNKGRMGKELWSDKEKGEKIKIIETETGRKEAEKIASLIKKISIGSENIAIFYRINARSRKIEEVLINAGIHYQIFGGLKFYQRKEIKDILAFLSVIINVKDDVSFKRIINVPPRGIGMKTLEKLQALSDDLLLPMYSTVIYAIDNGYFSKDKTQKLKSLISLIDSFIETKNDLTPSNFIDKVLNHIDYENYLQGFDNPEDRIENVKEFLNGVQTYETENQNATLEEYLQRISLYTDIDTYTENTRVYLMTVHNAKGLEFDNVIVAGMEHGTFPYFMRLEDEDLEEERRLFYVALTRAKKRIILTYAKQLSGQGSFDIKLPSCFIEELDMENNPYYYSKSSIGKNKVAAYPWANKIKSENKSIHASMINPAQIRIGDILIHKQYGDGEVTFINFQGNRGELTTVKLLFKNKTEKLFILKYSDLKKKE